MAWTTLAELVAHLSLNIRLVQALEVQFGTFNDKISAVAWSAHKLRTRSGGAFHGAPNERCTLSRCANERCTAHIIAEKPEPTHCNRSRGLLPF